MIRTRPVKVENQEEIIYNIIIEYLGDNKTFRFNDIIPYINSRISKSSININTTGIKKNLNSLLKKGIIVEGSKLTRDTALLNENRLVLFEFIEKNPGRYFNNIVKTMKMSKYVVYFHLQILLKFDLIRKMEIENHDVYYDSGFNPIKVLPLFYQSKGKSKKILSYLKENNIGHTKTEISHETHIHLNTVKKYLKILEEIDLISKETFSSKELYFHND